MVKRRKGAMTWRAVAWTQRDQLRFTQAVERFCSAVNDLERQVTLLTEQVVRRTRKPPPAMTPEHANSAFHVPDGDATG